MPAGPRQSPGRTPFDSPTSPMSRLGRVLSTSSSMPMPAGSWAGGSHERRMQASCSTRWSRHCMIDGRSITAGSCTTATGAAQDVSIKCTERLAKAVVEPPSAHCSRRNHQRSLQGRGDPWTRAMANLQSRRRRALEWVNWFPAAPGAIGNIPPADADVTTPCRNNRPWRHNLNQMASGKPRAVQTHQQSHPDRGPSEPCCTALHHARQAHAERPHRELNLFHGTVPATPMPTFWQAQPRRVHRYVLTQTGCDTS